MFVIFTFTIFQIMACTIHLIIGNIHKCLPNNITNSLYTINLHFVKCCFSFYNSSTVLTYPNLLLRVKFKLSTTSTFSSNEINCHRIFSPYFEIINFLFLSTKSNSILEQSSLTEFISPESKTVLNSAIYCIIICS